MHATLFASPRYALTLTLSTAELQTLLACSAIHYDSKCRYASQLGGFSTAGATWR